MNKMNDLGNNYKMVQFFSIPEENSPTKQQQNHRLICYKAEQGEDFEQYQQRLEYLNKQNEETLKKLMKRPNLLKHKLEESQKKNLLKKIKVDEQRQKENEKKRKAIEENEQRFLQKQLEKKNQKQNHNREENSLKELFSQKYQERIAKENQRKILASCGLTNLNYNNDDNFRNITDNEQSQQQFYGSLDKSKQDKKNFTINIQSNPGNQYKSHQNIKQTYQLNDNNSVKSTFSNEKYLQSILKENGCYKNQLNEQKRIVNSNSNTYTNKMGGTQNMISNFNIQSSKNIHAQSLQFNYEDKNFPLNLLDTRKKIIESEKTGELYKLPGFGIEKTPYYRMKLAKSEQKQRNKEKQDFILGGQKYFKSKESQKHINYQNIYETIKNLKDLKPTRNGINRNAQMIEKQFSLNNKLGQIVNSQYSGFITQDYGLQLETIKTDDNDQYLTEQNSQ